MISNSGVLLKTGADAVSVWILLASYPPQFEGLGTRLGFYLHGRLHDFAENFAYRGLYACRSILWSYHVAYNVSLGGCFFYKNHSIVIDIIIIYGIV